MYIISSTLYPGREAEENVARQEERLQRQLDESRQQVVQLEAV